MVRQAVIQEKLCFSSDLLFDEGRLVGGRQLLVVLNLAREHQQKTQFPPHQPRPTQLISRHYTTFTKFIIQTVSVTVTPKSQGRYQVSVSGRFSLF